MRLGFIVNPIAGIGGPLALKGSDGPSARAALARGQAGPVLARSVRALTGLVGRDAVVLTAAGAMGETAVRAAGLAAQVVHGGPATSTGIDTTRAVLALQAAGAQIIAFAGGDGTTLDIMAAQTGLPVLGIPAGVKMHSGVFATSPAAAAAMLTDAVGPDGFRTTAAEVIDRDEHGRMQLFGMLDTIVSPRRQMAKGMAVADDALLPGAIAEAAEQLADETFAIIGPGATMLAIKQSLGAQASLLGVDVFAHGVCIAADIDESRLWQMMPEQPPRLMLGVIGGQGFVIGRGNQQLSPRILARIGTERLMIVAGAAKLAGLSGRLLVDSGDEVLDARFAGHVRVHTGRRRTMMMRLDPA